MHPTGIRVASIQAARVRISRYILSTPTVLSPSLSMLCGAPVHLKLEHRQTTGSFKLRGATNALLSMTADARNRGVVAASTGNHGRGLAYAARMENVNCIICMSNLVPANKIEGVRALGAKIRIVGQSQDDAQVEVERLVHEEGWTAIPPFDHPDVIAGQGTIGLEILEAVPDVELVLVPVSGGGLAGGIAAAIKASRPSTRVVGISMERGAAMHASLAAGRPVLVEELATLADSLGGGIGLDNRYTYPLAAELLDDLILLSEAEIAAAIRHAYASEQEVLEGAGVVGIGALMSGKIEIRGPTVALLSGRNIDIALHRRIICEFPASGDTSCPV
jgi:threonine dehydratase